MALETAIPQGLEALLMDEAQRRALEEQLMERVRADIERSAGNKAQAINESAFGRGLGLSTENAFAQAENQRARDEALAKARIDAMTAARGAQTTALANAAQYQNAAAGRSQQASQFSQSQDQRNKELRQARDLSQQQMLSGGLAGLVGAGLQTAGHIYGPNIKDSLKDLFGGGGRTPGGYMPPPSPPSFSRGEGEHVDIASDYQAPSTPSANSFSFGDASAEPFNLSLGDLGFDPGASLFSPSVSVPDFGTSLLSQFPDLFGFNNSFDLSGLL